jgi:hypothetical protein
MLTMLRDELDQPLFFVGCPENPGDSGVEAAEPALSALGTRSVIPDEL